MNEIPLPPKPSAELTEDESSFILDKTLKAKHRTEGSVITFIDSFVRCKSISQASAEAGVHHKVGYSYRHRKDIANAIQQLTDKSAIKYGFDTSEIYERVKEVVTFDPIEVQNPDGTFKSNMHDISPEARRCIKKMEVKNLYNQVEDANGMKSQIIIGEVVKYEFYDKLKGAEMAGKEKEMFKNTTKVEHALTKDMQNILLESSRLANQRVIEDKHSIIDVTPIPVPEE